MKKTIGFVEFAEDFKILCPDAFSYPGLRLLFTYLTKCEEKRGMEIEFKALSLSCEYKEFTLKELCEKAGIDPSTEKFWKGDIVGAYEIAACDGDIFICEEIA